MVETETREKVVADEFTFYVGRTKHMYRLLGCIGFVGVGYLIRDETLYGWASIIFFGLLIPIYLVSILLPKSKYLRLDAEGFEVNSFFGKKRTKWIDVQRFDFERSFIIGEVKSIRILKAPHLHETEDTVDNIYDASLTEVMDALKRWCERYGSNRATISNPN
jgi:hypothetical protein